MVSHHPTKVGGNSHCSSGDIMFLVDEEQGFKCSTKSAITVYLYGTWHESTWNTMLASLMLARDT